MEEIARNMCRAQQRGKPSHGFAVLVTGDACEPKPKWMSYAVGGIMAIGAAAIGAGVVAIGSFGMVDLAALTAAEGASFIL
jgi:hypothetical protein